MKKNTSGQIIGAQMVTAADGTAFTGAVTVYVTGDGGVQAIGSVGSGICTHEGNGFHSYTPAQAETNYDHVAFTFIGTGAIPATIQTYPAFPQTGDSFARLGAPAGASIAADIVVLDNFLDTEIAAILALLDDPRTEPAQGAPPVNPDLATKIDYLYKAWRNRTTQTATQYSLYGDDAVTVHHKATVSDDGTTFDRTEVATGP